MIGAYNTVSKYVLEEKRARVGGIPRSPCLRYVMIIFYDNGTIKNLKNKLEQNPEEIE